MSRTQPPPGHSPGPWTHAGPYSVRDADGESVATCGGPRKAANGALIAAAPRLLRACSELWHLVRSLEGGRAYAPEAVAGLMDEAEAAMDAARPPGPAPDGPTAFPQKGQYVDAHA